LKTLNVLIFRAKLFLSEGKPFCIQRQMLVNAGDDEFEQEINIWLKVD